MIPVRHPDFTLFYTGTDITADIRPLLLRLTYIDKLSGASSELRLELENSDLRWLAAWKPEDKDEIECSIFYQNDPVKLDCGRFEVDNPVFTGYPNQGDRLSLGAQATTLSAPLRTKQTLEYENQSLKQIAEQVASRNGLTLTGEVVDVTFERITQNEQTDLDFLNQLAQDYGHLIKIENRQLIFYSWDDLENREPAFVLSRRILSQYRITPRLEGTYKAAEIKYQEPDGKEAIKLRLTAGEGINSEDTLKLNERVENRSQAELKAKEALRRENSKQVEAEFGVEGRIDAVAGIAIAVEDFGAYNGRYLVDEATHEQTKTAGYTTRLKCHKIQGTPEYQVEVLPDDEEDVRS